MKNTIAAAFFALLAGCATVETATAPSKDAQGCSVIASGFSGVVGVHRYAKRLTDAVSMPSDAPVKVKVATRASDSGEDGAIFFREFTFSPDGRLIGISPETDAMGMYTNQGAARQ